MKPATTLRELLKPPFLLSDDYICDSGGGYLAHAQISLTCVGDTAEFRKELQQFVIAALNEKWERDFGEPLRWIIEQAAPEDYDIVCPKCETHVDGDFVSIGYCYCPLCDQRLLPPEEA